MDLNRSIFSVVVRKAVILGEFSLCLRYVSEFWETVGRVWETVEKFWR